MAKEKAVIEEKVDFKVVLDELISVKNLITNTLSVINEKNEEIKNLNTQYNNIKNLYRLKDIPENDLANLDSIRNRITENSKSIGENTEKLNTLYKRKEEIEKTIDENEIEVLVNAIKLKKNAEAKQMKWFENFSEKFEKMFSEFEKLEEGVVRSTADLKETLNVLSVNEFLQSYKDINDTTKSDIELKITYTEFVNAVRKLKDIRKIVLGR